MNTRSYFPKKQARMAALAFLPSLLLAGGCAVGPDYARPEVQETPENWRSAAPVDAPTIANTAWWEIHKTEPELVALIHAGLENNKEIKMAVERLAQARASLGGAGAAYLPTVSYNGAAFRGDPRTFSASYQNGFTAAGAINWELDLWGRIRRLNESAAASYFATAENKNAVVLALVADIATGYFNLRTLDKQVAISEQTASTREEALKIAKARLKEGIGNAIDALQVEADALSARTSVVNFKEAVTLQENALCLLLGRAPGPILRAKDTRPKDIWQSFPASARQVVPAGLPADLLRNRPDLRAAERNVCAANAQIGAAIANYFPKVSLTGTLGFFSPQLKGLFDHAGTQGGGSLLGPLFDGFATYHTVKGAEARTREAVLAFQQTALNAFRETDNALSTLHTSRERLGLLQKQVAALDEALKKIRASYDAGKIALLPVLDADRTLFSAKLALVSAQNEEQAAFVNLYKSLGGGWRTADLKLPVINANGGLSEPPPATVTP
ncbi:MAG: efflux transporter outer membrane subunit [Puniceicoccales bacterium]|jgi:multidrug efflux system outer membrane protein|nr:efflux transporter outer membrane subunit [Puniceicoccales bacterium]